MSDFFTEHLKFEHRIEGLVRAFGDELTEALEDALEKVEGKIAVLMAKSEKTPSLARRKKYLQKQRAEIERVLAEVYADLGHEIKEKSIETARATPGILHKITTKSLPKEITVDLGVPSLSKRQIVSWFESAQIEGSFFTDWMSKLEKNAVDRVVAESRRSLILHETTAQGAKRIQEALDAGRHGAVALYETAVQSAVNWAELQYYRENPRITKVRFICQLDRRTTPICRELDGSVHPIEEADTVRPPLHVRCRSRLSPVLKGFDPAELEGATRITRQETVPRTVHHKDGTTSTAYRQFDAKEVPAKMTYNEWMKSMVFSKDPQDVAFAREALGPTRFNLVKAGKLKVDSLTYHGKLRTLKELEELM